ncbi:hypothetical protein [uncultured Sphingomonas sp.]|uniref:hypothetical protein n=1 Tax=uncultured Sphingomonas sp. TaxID=158754 RepID=UPI0035CC1892
MARSVLALLLLLAGCGRAADQPPDLNSLDRELTDADAARRRPAVTQALHDRITVDPTLTKRSGAAAVKPPPRPDPVDAATPRRALALAQRRASVARCAAVVHYAAGWANRLPADLPLYPDARVAEAAGSDAGRCRLRVVSYASTAAPARVIIWYYTRAGAAGYAPEHQRDGAIDVVGGTRGDDAFMAYVAARPGGGADVDFVSNAGR